MADLTTIFITLDDDRNIVSSSEYLGVQGDKNACVFNVSMNEQFANLECIVRFRYDYTDIFKSTKIPITNEAKFIYTIPELIFSYHGNVNIEFSIYNGDEMVYNSSMKRFIIKPSIETCIGKAPDIPTEIPYSHNDLIDRDLFNQHPIAAITDLQETLDNKATLIHTHVIADITDLHLATDEEDGLMSKEDKEKLDNIPDSDGYVLSVNGRTGNIILTPNDVDTYSKEKIANMINTETQERTTADEYLQSQIILKANITDVYTRQQINDRLAGKANINDVYNKSQVYTQTEVNDLLGDKADAANIYTKTETNDFIRIERQDRLLADQRLYDMIQAETARATNEEDTIKTNLNETNDFLTEVNNKVDIVAKGTIVYLGLIELETADITQVALTERANEILADIREINGNDALIDLTSNQWVYDGTDEIWFNLGLRVVTQASNTELGIVKGDTAQNKVSILADGSMLVNDIDGTKISGIPIANVSNLQSTITQINTNINTLAGNVYTKEESDATTSALQTDLSNERASRIQADLNLQNSITQNVNTLNNKIDNISTELNDYYTTSQVDSMILEQNQKIETERNARIAGDSSLGIRVDNEEAERVAAIEELQSQIDNLETGLIPKPSVATYADLATTYPNPEVGWLVGVENDETDNGNYNFYLWDGSSWIRFSSSGGGGGDLSNYYTKVQTDAQISAAVSDLDELKANKIDVYTQEEVNTNISSLKTYTDEQLATKIDSDFNFPLATQTTKGWMSPADKTTLDTLAAREYESSDIILSEISEKFNAENNQSQLNTTLVSNVKTNITDISNLDTVLSEFKLQVDTDYMRKDVYDVNNNGIVDKAKALIDDGLTTEMVSDGAITEDKLSDELKALIQKDSLIIQSNGIEIGEAQILNFIGTTITSQTGNIVTVKIEQIEGIKVETFNIVGDGTTSLFTFTTEATDFPLIQVFNVTSGEEILISKKYDSENNEIIITFDVPPTTGIDYKVKVLIES